MMIAKCSQLARPAGLEPATYGFEVRRSIQLSYGRIMIPLLYQNQQKKLQRTFTYVAYSA